MAYRDLMNMANRYTVRCIAICGRTVPRKAWNLPTIPSRNISASRSASYPPRAVLFDYIEGRVEKGGRARQWIRFRTPSCAGWNGPDATHKFNGEGRTTLRELTCDHHRGIRPRGVLPLATSPRRTCRNSRVLISFKGRVLHAHDFRDAVEFKDKDLLIIGTSYSAEDIGSQCWKYGAKSITVSHRTAAMGYDWPDNWSEVPLLIKVEGNTCTFKDGTTKDVDAIILCTGYRHHFPFMAEDLKLHTANRLATADLYKGVAFIHNPALFYIGMQDQWFTFNMFDAQAWWARDVIMGRIALPDKAAMQADVDDRVAREDANEDDYACIRYQGDYVKELIAETDYPSFDVDGANEAFFQWKKHKKKNIMTFRDNSYKSVITGTVAPAHHTPWKDALDDTLESYLQN